MNRTILRGSAVALLSSALLIGCGTTVDIDRQAPTLSASVSATELTSSGSVTLNATATDNVGVTKIEIYEGSTRLLEDTTPADGASLTISYGVGDNGTHTYRIVVYDAAGNKTSTTLTVDVNITVSVEDKVKPTITSFTPSAGRITLPGDVTLQVAATDNVGVSKVEFFEGTTRLGEDTTPADGFTTKLSFTGQNNGAHTYKAVAYDASGNTATAETSVTVDIDTTAPALVTPADDQTVADTLTVTGTLSDAQGVGTFTYELNGADPVDVKGSVDGDRYSFDVSLAPGENVLTLVATDTLGNKVEKTIKVDRLAGKGAIRGVVVDQNIGAVVGASQVRLYRDGKMVGKATTSADGTFDFGNIKAGTYDVQLRKAGFGGSDLYGLVVEDGAVDVRMIQRPAFDTSATTTPAKLILTRGDGTTPLANATFTNGVDFNVKTAPDSEHVRPMRILYAQIGRTPGSAAVTASTTANNWNQTPPLDYQTAIDTGNVTLPNNTFPNFIAGLGSATGDKLYMEFVAYDYNYNYARYIVPITLINTSTTAANTVVAPTGAAAVSYTVKQEGSWTTPYAAGPSGDATVGGDAAAGGSGTYAEIRWCYTNTTTTAKPFAFDIERSSDGTTFTKIGTVGGGANASCPANQLTRPFSYRDNSAELTPGKTFTYRVVARGANTVASNLTVTSPLAPFFPQLLAPGDETNDVSVTPTFTWSHPQLEIGADGAGYNLRLRDLVSLSGYNLPGTAANSLIRVEEGTGTAGNKVPVGDALVYTTAVLTDTAGLYGAAKPNRIPVDPTTHNVSMTLDVFGVGALQPLRPYKWELYSAFAYKYNQNEGGRISAYSVYTWPDGTVAPIAQTRPVTQSLEFTTGPVR
ncbi:Ig-like domain-containing protein [Deinococcus pimensis]|uniref:Ig-like domain-containing protein n=1 Tax=Deinococcus pimensis TaxID=309888 RepID=UPI000485FC92|nr:Ig-like domain-containing protein [Deinococcus pimensis]